MKYKIEFTKEQLNCIAKGLEFYSRFLAGQWRIPDELQFQEYEKQGKSSDFWPIRNVIEDSLNSMSSLLTRMPKNQSYGIGSDDLHENAKIAYDIYMPILEEFNKDTESWGVYSSPGLTYSKEGRIKINTNE